MDSTRNAKNQTPEQRDGNPNSLGENSLQKLVNAHSSAFAPEHQLSSNQLETTIDIELTTETSEPHVYRLASYSGLLQLKNAVEERRLIAHLSDPIHISDLAILEAELGNQGILKRNRDNSYRLSALLEREATFWRWRAKRIRKQCGTDFIVNVPKYLVHRANELIYLLEEHQSFESIESANPTSVFTNSRFTSPWRFSFRSKASLLEELSYLNDFAKYLLGNYDPATTHFERGLSIVLRHIEIKAKKRVEDLSEGVIFCLPLTRNSFLEKLKAPNPSDV